MRRFVLILVFLGACDSPSIAFRGAVHGTAEAGGSRFGIHVKGDRVEAYRVSREWRPRLDEVRARAVTAIEEMTGCAVRPGSVDGDVAIIRARLHC